MNKGITEFTATGRLRLLGALATGILLVAIQPLADQGWLAWGCLVPLLLACHGSSVRAALGLGLVSGFLYAYGVFSWFLSVPGVGWLQSLPPAAILACYTAVFAAGSAGARRGFAGLLMVPCLWIGLEWLRGHAGFLSLPWATLAHSQHQNIPLLQIAAVTGESGISYVLVAANVLLADAVIKRRLTRPLFLGIAAILVLHLYGQFLAGSAESLASRKILLVQPHISVHETAGERGDRLRWQKLQRLTREAIEPDTDLVVWPETVLRGLKRNPQLLGEVRKLSHDYRVPLVTGVTEFEKFAVEPAADRRGGVETRSYNSAVLVLPDGTEPLYYYKMILVPFGEYVPVRSYLRWPRWLVPVAVEMSRGEHYIRFRLPDGVTLGPLICWENLFPGFVRRSVAGGAELLVQLVNNNWFGPTAAPFQHNAASVLRAVENRRSLLVASNSGPSQVIDPWGRVTAVTADWFAESTVSSRVPVNAEISFYTRFGDLFLWCAVGISALAALLSLVKQPASRLPVTGND